MALSSRLLLSCWVMAPGCYLSHTPDVDDAPEGICTTTTQPFSPAFGGIAGGDAICARELPGTHFYQQSRDGDRSIEPAVNPLNGLPWPGGYGEIEVGDCANCLGWTASSSGPFDPSIRAMDCPDGYVTSAALVPRDMPGAAWRICEGANWPLTCCFD